MLGSPCSPCCGGCTPERAYPIWQQLLASQCAVSVVTDCKRQQAATSVLPGFASGQPSVVGKYFPSKQDVWSALRFFHRPSPNWNASYQLSVDLQSSAAMSSLPDGDRGVVEWKYEDPDIKIVVRAYVNDRPVTGAILPPAANSDTDWARFENGECSVYYTISARRVAYSFFTRDSDFDPSPFVVNAYTGTRPPLFSGQSETPFTTYLATASPPIIEVREETSSFETGFEVRSALPNSTVFKNNAALAAWWPTFSLPLAAADLQGANPGAALGLGLFGNGTLMHAAPEVFCTQSAGQLTTTAYTTAYQREVGQWVDNAQQDWISQPSFTTFWSFASGARMSVQGTPYQFRYDFSSGGSFSSTLNATISQ